MRTDFKMWFALFLSPSLSLCAYLISVYFVYFFLFVYLILYLSIFLPLSVSVSKSPTTCASFYFSTYVSIYPPVYPSIHLTFYQSVSNSLSLYLCIHLPVFPLSVSPPSGIILRRPESTATDRLTVYMLPFSSEVWAFLLASIPLAALTMHLATTPRQVLHRRLMSVFSQFGGGGKRLSASPLPPPLPATPIKVFITSASEVCAREYLHIIVV